MKYKIEKPKTDKDGLINAVMMISNNLESGNVQEAQYGLTDLIDSLSSKCVRFDWSRSSNFKKMAKQNAEGIAAYALENPTMVD